MVRLLTLLLLVSTLVFGQDTLAVVDARFATLNEAHGTEILGQGDSVLIRMIYAMESDASWYYKGQKAGDVDLRFLGVKELLGFQRKGNDTYYYGTAGRGFKSLIKVLKATGNEKALPIVDHKLDGQVVGAKIRLGNICIVTLHTEDKKVRVYEFNQDKASVLLADLALPWQLGGLLIENATLIDANQQRRMSEELFKIFLDDNSVSVVFDDAFRDIVTPGSPRRTLVMRKDFVTGKQDADGLRAPESTAPSANSNKRESRSRFKSYLDKNLLYQIISQDDKCRLVVRDLDKNEIIYETDLPVVSADDLFERLYDPVSVIKLNDKILTNYRLDPIDVSIDVENAGGQKLITIAFRNDYVKGVNVAPHSIRPDHHPYIVCNYLVGSPETGFTLAAGDLLRRKQLADEYESAGLNKRFDYFVHSITDNSVIAMYSMKKSKRYVFVRFPAAND